MNNETLYVLGQKLENQLYFTLHNVQIKNPDLSSSLIIIFYYSQVKGTLKEK